MRSPRTSYPVSDQQAGLADRVLWRGRWRPVALAVLLLVGLLTLVLVRATAPPGPPEAVRPSVPTGAEPVDTAPRGAQPGDPEPPTGAGPDDSGPSADTGPDQGGPLAVAPSTAADQADPASTAGPGDGFFREAAGGSPIAGTDGPLRRYRVVVEAGTGQEPTAFAAAVDATLADPRSWIASEQLRLQRVSGPQPADFTIYLATAVTSERMCAEGGLVTAGYTSCRLPGQVIINLDRWLTAVPDYDAPLEVYRAYVINHEVGHELGELHEACPGPGRPAPVMQQQTYGLAGCVANAWPYVDGRRYAGDLVP